MKQNKITGLHLIMAANQKGGSSKSTTIAEIAAGLKVLNVPTVIVNLEVTHDDVSTANQRLRTMLRGSHISDIDCDNPSTVLEQFGVVMSEAQKSNAVILMDIPGAMMTSGNKIWENLMTSKYFDYLNSFSLFGTVSNEIDHFVTATHVTNAVEHLHKHVFYRGWNNPASSEKLENMEEWKAISALYPSIIMPTRHDAMENVIFGRHPYQKVPGLIQLKSWYEQNEPQLTFPIKQPIFLVIQAIDEMSDFLKTNYLPIIKTSND